MRSNTNRQRPFNLSLSGRRLALFAISLLLTSGVVLIGPVPAAADPPLGPCVVDVTDVIGWWPGEGDLSAAIGPDLSGATGFTPAVVGQGMSFIGNEDVQAPGLPTVSNAVTAETWFRTSFNGTAQALISRWGANNAQTGDDSYELTVTVNNQLLWHTQADSGSGQQFTIAVRPEIYDGEFHHVAGTWDGVQSNLYLDGQLVASTPVSGHLNAALNEPLRLGRYGNQPFHLTGVLDEPTVFSRALSGSEIAAIYEAGPDGKCGQAPSDTTPPTVTVTTPADGGSYVLGTTVLADYACEDEQGGSGVASCNGTVTVGSPFDTSSVGAKSFSVTGTDNALNTKTETVSYDVVYEVVGAGLGAGGGSINPPPIVNTGKAGRTYLATWQLVDGNEAFVSSLSAVVSVTSKKVPCNGFAGDSSDSLEAESSGNAGLRYDAASDAFQYNWKTPKTPGCYELFVNLLDGNSLSANFELK